MRLRSFEDPDGDVGDVWDGGGVGDVRDVCDGGGVADVWDGAGVGVLQV